jgi:hypothetical protein
MFKRRIKEITLDGVSVFIRSLNLAELAELALEKAAAKTGEVMAKVVAHWLAKLCADKDGKPLFTEEQLLQAEDSGPLEYLFLQVEQHAAYTPDQKKT